MSERPRNIRSYLNALSARRRKELIDEIKELQIKLDQAKRRKEYHTVMELNKEISKTKHELELLK